LINTTGREPHAAAISWASLIGRWPLQAARCFFFQAEDGIRYGHVTGVQTCALPILRPSAGNPYQLLPAVLIRPPRWSICHRAPRSEERRVGKECRCGGARYH